MAECSWAHMREKDETWAVGCAALQAAANYARSGTKTAASMTQQQVHGRSHRMQPFGGLRAALQAAAAVVFRLLGGLQDLSLEVGCADLQAAAEGVLVTALAAGAATEE